MDGEGNPKVDGEGNPEVTGGGNPKASREEAHNPGATDGPGRTHSSRNPNKTGKSSGSGNTGKTNGSSNVAKTNKKEWSAAEKAKPIRLNVVLHFGKYSNTCTATVQTPDGSVYRISNGTTSSRELAFTNMNNAMQDKLKKAGWTNVVLESKTFEWSSDGSKAEGKVARAEQKTVDKNAHHNLKIEFVVRGGVAGEWSSSGSATVVTPDGVLHQVTTGVSTSRKSARKALAKAMEKLLRSDEGGNWKNFTLNNDTFDDWK